MLSNNAASRIVPFARTAVLLAVFAFDVGGCLLASFWCGEYARIQRYAVEGYPLRGTYQNVNAGDNECFSAAFIPDEDKDETGTWQLTFISSTADRQWTLEGTYRQTADPNIYELLDEDEGQVAVAHLAYATRDGHDGELFVSYGDKTFVLPKISAVPAYYTDFDAGQSSEPALSQGGN